MIGFIGAIIGAVISSGVTIWLERTGIDISKAASNVDMPIQGILYPDWTLTHVLVSVLLGMLAAGLAALYPGWRASRQKPAEALRK